jgi:hypothetical protein
MNVGHLYDALLVPAEWVALDVLRRRRREFMLRCYGALGWRMDRKCFDAAFDGAFLNEGRVDFALLDVSSQLGIIRRLMASPRLKRRIGTEPAGLLFAPGRAAATRLVRANRVAVGRELSLGSFLPRFRRCFSKAGKSAPSGGDPRAITGHYTAVGRARWPLPM